MTLDLTSFELLYAAFVVLVAYIVLGVVGFGSALIAVPLLAWHWPLALVVPLILLTDIPAALTHAGLNLKQVAWREIPGLLPMCVVGAIGGVLLLTYVKGVWMLLLLLALGAYIFAVGLRGLRGVKTSPVSDAGAPAGRLIAGGLIGFVEALYGTAGPVVMAWLMRRIHTPQGLRATMPTAMLLFASIAIASSGVAGLLSASKLWLYFACLLPIAVGGVWVGHQLNKKIDAKTMAPIVHGLLLLSGVALSVRAIYPLL